MTWSYLLLTSLNINANLKQIFIIELNKRFTRDLHHWTRDLSGLAISHILCFTAMLWLLSTVTKIIYPSRIRNCEPKMQIEWDILDQTLAVETVDQTITLSVKAHRASRPRGNKKSLWPPADTTGVSDATLSTLWCLSFVAPYEQYGDPMSSFVYERVAKIKYHQSNHVELIRINSFIRLTT